MKFFKHFTDSHRGKSLQQIKKKFGWEGIGRYWTLVELCAEKLSKNAEEDYSERHCVFEFEESYLMLALGYPNLTLCSRYLDAVATLGLAYIEREATLVRCSMPKLLQYIDRDAKRARQVRGHGAPKKEELEKEKEKELEIKRSGEFISNEISEEEKQSRLALVRSIVKAVS